MRRPAFLVVCAVLAGCMVRLPVGLRIEGLKEVSKRDLLDAASHEVKNFEERGARLCDAADAADTMQFFLREQGYARAEAVAEKRDGGIVIRVKEGRRLTLAGVRLVGVKSLPECEVKALFDLPGSGPLGACPAIYDVSALQDAKSTLEGRYLREGFYRIVLKKVRFVECAPGKAIAIVEVEEGKRYVVKEVKIEGVRRRCAEADAALDSPFDPALPGRLATAVRRELRDDGYILCQATSEAVVDDVTATVKIRVVVHLGEQHRLGVVRVAGHCRTKASFIRARVPLPPGAVVRGEAMDRTVAELYRSTIFESVTVKPIHVAPGVADLFVGVREGKSRRVDAEVGWGSYELARGKVSYLDPNLFGIGRILRASVLASVRMQGGEVEVEDRWLLPGHDRLTAKVLAYRREEPYYTSESVGLELGVEHHFDPKWRLRGGYRFEVEDSSDVVAVVPPEFLKDLEDDGRESAVFARLRYDDRDDLFVPVSGMLAEGSVLWSLPALGATLEYVELEARVSKYFDLGAGGSIALGAFVGTRQPFGISETLPITVRYFLGGADSVRSFGQDELTPVDAFGNGVGGLTAAEGHVEWRHVIKDPVYGALFYDFGVVSLDPFSFDGVFGEGFGAGLRIHTPVGPMRLDAAYNPGDLLGATERWQVHFSFGFGF